MRASGGGERELAHYQTAFEPLCYGVAAAILLTLLLRETGPRASAIGAGRSRALLRTATKGADRAHMINKELQNG